MKIGEIIQITMGAVFTLSLFYWGFFVQDASRAFVIALGVFLANYFIIFFHEKKYKKNNPFKSKKKNTLGKKIRLGLLAGFHYIFFIGTYDHKKYNTQIWYPETTECIWGNISQAIILIFYMIIAIELFKLVGYYYLIFLIIPIITNTISLSIKKFIR